MARGLVRKLQLEKVKSGLSDLKREYNEAAAANDWERAREIDRIRRKLQFEKVKAEIEKLILDYKEAVSVGDSGKARELDRLKSNLDKELQRLGPAIKKSAQGQTNWGILHLILWSRRKLTAYVKFCFRIASGGTAEAGSGVSPISISNALLVCCPWGGHCFGV